MMKLYRTVLKNTMRQRSTWFVLAVALFPLVTLITELLDTDFMQINGLVGSVSVVEYLGAIFSTQRQLLLAIIILAFMANQMFYEEIQTGRLGFYKDQSRSKIMQAKVGSLLTVYALYFIVLFISSLVTYYGLLNYLPTLSGTFLPDDKTYAVESILTILGAICDGFAVLAITVALSTTLTSGYTILGAIFITLVTLLSGHLKGLSRFIPSGYISVMSGAPTWQIALAMIVLSLIYSVLGYWLAYRVFKKAEY